MSTRKSNFAMLFIVISMVSWVFSGVCSLAQVADYNPDFRPGYYRVYNVANNDVLNIRADSDSASPIVGSYAFDAKPVEVLRQEHNWGFVIVGERNGWVSMKYLTPISVATIMESQIPVDLWCGGTEPFWGLELGEENIVLSFMGEKDRSFRIQSAAGFAGMALQDGFVQASGVQSNLTGIVSAEQCSDGMSDRDYGWGIDLVFTGTIRTIGLSGCCRMAVSP